MPDSNRPSWFSLRGAAFGLALGVVLWGFLLLAGGRALPSGSQHAAVTPGAGGAAPGVQAAPTVQQAAPIVGGPAAQFQTVLVTMPPALAYLPEADRGRVTRLVACLLKWKRPAQADALAAGVTRVEAREGLRLWIVQAMTAQTAEPGAGLDDRALEAALAIVARIEDPATRADALLALAERTPECLADRILESGSYGKLATFVAARLSEPPEPPPVILSYPGQGLMNAAVAELSRQDAGLVAAGKTLAERQRALRTEAERLYDALLVREDPRPALPQGFHSHFYAYGAIAMTPAVLSVASVPPTSVASLVDAAIAKTLAAQVHAEEEAEASRKALSEWGRGLVQTGTPGLVGALTPSLAARLLAGRGRRRGGV